MPDVYFKDFHSLPYAIAETQRLSSEWNEFIVKWHDELANITYRTTPFQEFIGWFIMRCVLSSETNRNNKWAIKFEVKHIQILYEGRELFHYIQNDQSWRVYFYQRPLLNTGPHLVLSNDWERVE
jgi:hypothetical protein